MERFGSPSHRVFSVRSILTFVLVVVVTALLWVLIGGHETHAADPTAAWSGDAIVYDNHGYNKATDFKDATGTIPSGATVYQTPQQTVDGSSSKKVFILYFSPGVDPPTATSVQYVELDISSSNVTSNPQNKRTVTITLKGTEDGSGSSCSVQGIGWIICPVSVFIASGMDNLFSKVLAPMMAAQPSVLGDPNNSMYIAWNIMRNIANVAFVIVFLIIIYSQLTNVGISNYGLKKLIPRLIVAAILVNLSFIVTALAIDISNILGYSIQSVFESISKSVFHLTNDNVSGLNSSPWTVVTAAVLAGGGVVGGIYYLAGAGLWVLLPILLGVIAIIILVIVVLAARQAIIVIMVIVAPLAFVAYLLPNTEKWFDKWKDLFFTMLVFFPAFSLVFGGSQLAGQIIIQNAGDNIVMLIFGLAVQVAPLVITPLLLKFSGSLLGKITQIANNPSKGLLDRSKNWAKDRGELTRQRNLAGEGRRFNPTTWGAGMVRASDFRKRRLKDRTEAYKQEGDNNYHDSRKYQPIQQQQAEAEERKNAIHNTHAAHLEHLKTTPGSSRLYNRAITTQTSKENLEAAQNRTTEYYNSRRVVGGTPLNASMNNLEASKATLETSENDKAVYLDRQRMMAGTVLNATVAPLEASKLRVESTKNQYSTMVEDMKLNPHSDLYHIAQGAQSSKEHLEAAQNQVQALFDSQRRTAGTGLNMSTVVLEESKAAAEASKSLTGAYVNELKVDHTTVLHRNVVQAEEAKLTLQTSESNLTRTLNDLKVDDSTVLHRNNIQAEQAKLATQVSETRLGRVIEEYKTGMLDRTGDPALGSLMESMVSDVSRQAAEAQGTQAAKNMQTKNIAEAFTAVDAAGVRTQAAQDLLNTAASVDPYGNVRAEAGALSTLEKIIAEARGSNMKLIEARALAAGETTKDYAVKTLLQNRLDGDLSESDDLISAALEIAGQEAQIPILRKVRRSANFNQEDVSAMLSRQSNVMKTKGGFDLQANYELANVSEETMDASIAGALGSTSAKDFAGLKFAAIADYATRIDNIVKNSERETSPIYGPAAREGLQKTYFNLTIALKDSDLIRELGDNLAPAIDMHKRLHKKYQNPDAVINYDKIDPRKADTTPLGDQA